MNIFLSIQFFKKMTYLNYQIFQQVSLNIREKLINSFSYTVFITNILVSENSLYN